MNNFLPPGSCLLCATDSGQAALCPSCISALPKLPAQHCPRCALPTPDGGTCGHCLKHPPAFDSTHATFLYSGALSHLIPAAKFGSRWHLLPALAELMAFELQQHPRPDFIVPMPLHPLRLQERGFNQAQEIAAPLARALGIPVANGVLLRSRNTEHQTRLTEKQRWKNMRHAFAAQQSLEGKSIALVDDVMTTGASLAAAAHALKDVGAKRVEAWVLARTP